MKYLLFLFIAVAGVLGSGGLYAATPVWTFSAPGPARVTVSGGEMATVQYTVTNQSRKPKNLILKATHGVSASVCHLAGKGSTCSLILFRLWLPSRALQGLLLLAY